MTTIEIKLDESVASDIAEEITKKVCYLNQTIAHARLLKAEGKIQVEINDANQVESVRSGVENLIAKMKAGRARVKPEVLRQRESALKLRAARTYRGLSREGFGTLARDGEFLQILHRFDSLFKNIGIKHFGAVEQEYNALIPTDWLRRAGYLSSFPHSLTFAIHLREDYDMIEKFAARHRKGEELNFASLDEIANSEYCLSPAVCYHTYGVLSTLPPHQISGDLGVFTAQNRCFRYESKNIADVERLWEFSMREIVLVGKKDQVLEARSKGIELVWQLVELLDLTAWLETAVDPFFTTDFQSKRFFQLANQLKYELRLPLRENESLAVASFNYHENFFGDKFTISTTDGTQVHTGCIAFGLERFVHAVLIQLGVDSTLAGLEQAEQKFLG